VTLLHGRFYTLSVEQADGEFVEVGAVQSSQPRYAPGVAHKGDMVLNLTFRQNRTQALRTLRWFNAMAKDLYGLRPISKRRMRREASRMAAEAKAKRRA